MSRSLYESYEYIDPDHQYTYPKSDVLINKQNIRDEKEAHLNEHN